MNPDTSPSEIFSTFLRLFPNDLQTILRLIAKGNFTTLYETAHFHNVDPDEFPYSVRLGTIVRPHEPDLHVHAAITKHYKDTSKPSKLYTWIEDGDGTRLESFTLGDPSHPITKPHPVCEWLNIMNPDEHTSDLLQAWIALCITLNGIEMADGSPNTRNTFAATTQVLRSIQQDVGFQNFTSGLLSQYKQDAAQTDEEKAMAESQRMYDEQQIQLAMQLSKTDSFPANTAAGEGPSTANMSSVALGKRPAVVPAERPLDTDTAMGEASSSGSLIADPRGMCPATQLPNFVETTPLETLSTVRRALSHQIDLLDAVRRMSEEEYRMFKQYCRYF